MRQRRPHGFAPLLTLTATAMLGVVSIGGLALLDSYDQAVAQAQQLTTDLALIAGRDVSRDFLAATHAVDDALTALSLPGLDRTSPALRSAALFSTLPDTDDFGSTLVLSPTGLVTAISGNEVLPSNSFADRAYFQHHRADASAAVFVGPPVTGRLDGRRLVTVSRRVPAPDGGFGGVVVASIRLSSFRRLFDQLDLGGHGAITLVSEDGTMLARNPKLPDSLLSPAPGWPAFLRAAPSPKGFWRAVGPDGVARFYAVRRVQDLPLMVLVGTSVQDVLGPWWRKAELMATLMAVLGAVELLLLLALGRQLRRRRIAEARLMRLNRRLEERVTREVLAREAVHDRIVAGQRMEALGQLAGGVAHDLNNVLQAISSANDLLARQGNALDGNAEASGSAAADPNGSKRLTNLITEATRRGTAVTHRLLAFARRSELRAKTVDLVLLVGGLSNLLAHTLGGNMRVEMRAEEACVSALVDAAQLETVLINLVTNARDAMAPSGGVVILTVGKTAVSKGHAGMAFMAVSDAGSGMSPAVLARATEPFFTTKPVGQGTGLGLAMARGFAEQSGGRLDIESRIGVGTTVTLLLPQGSSSPAHGILDPAAPPATAQRSLPLHAHRRVLLVDDDELVLSLLAESLQQLGHEVLQAKDAPAALRLLDATSRGFEVLVTDLSMPGMNGLELIAAARCGRPALPAILITGYAGEETSPARTGASSGEHLLLYKPLRDSPLAAAISAVTATGACLYGAEAE